MESQEQNRIREAWSDHGRQFGQYRFVYPVLSRRAKGISLGVNLNPDLVCNFDCPYCQVDRETPGEIPERFTLEGFREELERALRHWQHNRFMDSPRFQGLPGPLTELKDICLSGDGEPTLSPKFPEVCHLLRSVQGAWKDTLLKLTLITNATLLHQPQVRAGLVSLTGLRGEIWGKLDAGTEPWFKQMSRSRYTLSHIEDNLCRTVRDFPLRIQTMLCMLNGKEPDQKELEAWAQRIVHIQATNPTNLLEVQLYTIVRRTATHSVAPVSDAFLNHVSQWLRLQISAPV
ncbi:MAG TPA: hypothetical protein VLM37_10100, partial [Fibrobacteraceae bacterium]|nr:hypothetical protein [Fibrobacteraceae bacterium]